jgi:myo-inositol-1(or 4)-monophosphatase
VEYNFSMSITARYVAAQQIAVKAGELARDFFSQRATLAVEAKGRQDFVSHADRAVEQLIRAEIEREFPGDGFLGEESAATSSGSDDRLWVVDPIDGTHNFLRGARYYCVSIAYVEHGRCEIGVVFDPEHAELFHARRGHGSWCEQGETERRMHASDCASLGNAFVCLGHHDRRPDPRYIAVRQALMDRGAAMRNMGAAALQLAHVAADRYDAFIELSLNAWDALAGLLLVEEAGGYAAPFPGPEGIRRPSPALGCAKGLAAELVPLVGAW